MENQNLSVLHSTEHDARKTYTLVTGYRQTRVVQLQPSIIDTQIWVLVAIFFYMYFFNVYLTMCHQKQLDIMLGWYGKFNIGIWYDKVHLDILHYFEHVSVLKILG